MTPELELHTPSDLPRPFGFSHVALVPPGHGLVWTAGQVAMDAEGAVVGVGDWEVQARTVFEHLTRALAAGGAGWPDVFRLMFYVTGTAALATVRSVRDEFVDRSRPPASTLVQVAGLALPDLLIEVEAIAAVPGRG